MSLMMEPKKSLKLSREKHLDHMVRVVPLIVLGYALQSYVLLQMKSPLSMNAVFVLGASLIAMIGAFVAYDVKHEVEFFEDHFTVGFFGIKKKISYSEVKSVVVKETEQTFTSLKIQTTHASFHFRFVDNALEIKHHIEAPRAFATAA